MKKGLIFTIKRDWEMLATVTFKHYPISYCMKFMHVPPFSMSFIFKMYIHNDLN